MKLPFQTVIFSIISLIYVSLGKVIFHEELKSDINLIKYIVQSDIFPRLGRVQVIDLGYEEVGPDQLTSLTKSLHEEHLKTSIVVSDILDDRELSVSFCLLILLLNKNKFERAVRFLDYIGLRKSQVLFAVVWFEWDFHQLEYFDVLVRVSQANFSEVIYASFSSGLHKHSFNHKGENKTLTLYFETNYLSKLRSAPILTRYKTNKNLIQSTVNRMKLQQRYNIEAINRYPFRALLYLHPILVEKDPVNSHLTGIAIKFLNVIANHLGSRISLRLGNQHDYGSLYLNGSPSRAYREITEGTIEISPNLYFQVETGKGVKVIQHSQETFCFIMLMQDNQVRTWSVLMPFQTSVWISFLISNMVFLAVYMMVKEKKWKVIWLLQSSVSVMHLPAKKLHHRILWSSWLVYIVVINAAYISSYVTQLIPEEKQHAIKTLSDLVTRNITLLSDIGLFDEVLTSLPSKNLTPYFGSPLDINMTSALLTTRLTRINLFKRFGHRFYRVDECLMSRPVGIMTSSRHPNLPQVYKIVKRVVHAGLFDYWLKTHIFRKSIDEEQNFVDGKDRQDYRPLKLIELKTIFVLLTIGLLLSIVVFIKETWYFKVTKLNTSPRSRPEIFKVYPYTE